MRHIMRWLTIVMLAIGCFMSRSWGNGPGPNVYVPYSDLAKLIDPQDKAVLMDRAEFGNLLTAAQANARQADSLELGYIKQAEYAAGISGENLTLTGSLEVVCTSSGPIAVPLGFGRIGLTQVVLDGNSAPLGYDKDARLTLIVTGKGKHQLKIVGTGKLTELPSGGMEFSLSLPAAAVGKMKLHATGDLEIHATVPQSPALYDKDKDRTEIDLTVGGQDKLTVVLLGNGRQEDDKAILLAESATTVTLNPLHQELGCLYTVQMLRRGVRQLQFHLPSEWTVTDVTCPDLVKWSVGVIEDESGQGLKLVTVRLRSAKTRTMAVHIKATAMRHGQAWHSPRVILNGAAFQRGYLMVTTAQGLHVRGEKLSGVRRENATAIAATGLVGAATGRMFFHWGMNWSVDLEVASSVLRRSVNEKQTLVVSSDQVSLIGEFELTAIGRELFNMTFVLPEEAQQWHIETVQVNEKTTGFEYRLLELQNERLLRIELAHPIQPEKMAVVKLVLRHVPSNWHWPSDAPERSIAVPLIESQAQTVAGEVLIWAIGDLDASPTGLPDNVEAIPVGRMASLGISADIQHAYSYKTPTKGEVKLQVLRRRPRISADSVGLFTVSSRESTGDWRIVYDISRAQAGRLYLLTDKSIGEKLTITSATVPIRSKNIVEPGEQSVSLSAKLQERYNLWMLDLDHQTIGEVAIMVHCEQPLVKTEFVVPLVRPICQGQISEQLAVQASEELAVDIQAEGVKEIDAMDLPQLPVEANRVLAAFRLKAATIEAATAETDSDAVIRLQTAVHENCEIPVALAVSGALTTYIDLQGSQRTEATFRIANAGEQFLTFKLPENSQLWSLRVAGKQAKPQRSAEANYQVALGQFRKPVPVKIVYSCPSMDTPLDSLELGAVELIGMQVNQVSWNVIPPPGYQITGQKTNMQSRDLARPTPAYIKLYNFVSDHFLSGAIFLPSLGRAREMSKSVVTASQLRGIGLAIAMYRDDFDGQWPDSLDRLVETGDVSQEMLYDTSGYGFEYFPPPGNAEVSPDTVIARSSVIHGRRSVLHAASNVTTEHAGRSVEPWYDYAESEGKAIAAEEMSPGDKPQRAETQRAYGVRIAQEGRLTIPVDLVPTPGTGPSAGFTGLGKAKLIVKLTNQSLMSSWWAVGFMLIITAAMALTRQKGKVKAIMFFTTLSAASLLAIWWPATTPFANGAFVGGLCLLPLYLLIGFVRWLSGKRRLSEPVFGKAATTVTVLLAVLVLITSAQDASASRKNKNHKSALPPVIIPYEGDATQAQDSQKVLISYRRFVELWNQAHPEDPIDTPQPQSDVSLADVRYTVTVKDKQLELLLKADVKTYGTDWAVLSLPISGLAVTEVTIDGQETQLQMSNKGMILMLPSNVSGRLQLKAVVEPEYLGRRGNASFSLPPLPGAVMTVVLPEDDLELEVDGIESPLARDDQLMSHDHMPGTARWSFPLGMARELSLRWLPKMELAVADTTLSAVVEHDVYAFHWAIVGVSRITYDFSAGLHDRFGLLLPTGATITDMDGANFRDYRELGNKTIDGRAFNLVEVRLHRPADKSYKLTVRWLDQLPALDETLRLSVIQAANVSRESGTVTLHAAGGMMLKAMDVTGGRRADMLPNGESPDAQLTSERAQAVARYYWPYRPFSLFVKLSHIAVTPKITLNQLVRVSADRVQLLAEAQLKSSKGQLFGADFSLPRGYELLSVVGPAVGDFYEHSNDAGRFLHVNFSSIEQETTLALVLVRNDVALDLFSVPTIMYVDSAGQPLQEQQGRIAVQVAKALEAQTATSARLKPVSPDILQDWLDENQIRAVQYAYRYEAATPSLALNIHRQPTELRVEVFTGVAIRATAAMYTYRLRYDISGSPLDRLNFSVPNEYASLMDVQSPAMRSIKQTTADNGQTDCDVALINETTGTVDVTVNFALPLDASTKVIPIPRIETTAPAGCRTIVAVQNAFRHDISIKETINLNKLAVSEQQQLMPPAMAQSLQYVFQSFEPDWSLSLDFTPAKLAKRIQAVVDLLAVTTVVDRDGRCRYEAKVALQNRSEQFLHIKVPQGLHLWSAIVADRPVKPVIEADAQKDEVLIPLVKTSPGGLPYDVSLYFAGEGITPLNGITRLKPPAISVVGIPIMQTTWSLRLPGGYRYLRPGGNMSPIAGTAEMLSISVEARLKQLERLGKTYRDTSDISGGTSITIAQDNLRSFGTQLAGEIGQAESFLEANKDELSKEEYRRLKGRLGQQKASQNVLIQGHERYVQKQAEQDRKDITYFLNFSSSNTGMAEVLRDEALLNKPAFVGENEEQQIAQLEEQLKGAQQRQHALQSDRKATAKKEQESQQLKTDHPQIADSLILSREDKDEKMGTILQQLSQQDAAQITQQQEQMKRQLGELKDNRMQRQFSADKEMTKTANLRLRKKSQKPAMAGMGGMSAGMGFGKGVPADGGARGRRKGDRRVAGVTAAGDAFVGLQGPQAQTAIALSEGAAIAGFPTAPAPAPQQHYVAAGVYSLPVTLPEGETRLDFARPSGDAELSILAIPVNTIHNLYGTVTVILALLVVMALIRIWPERNKEKQLSTRRLVGYLVVVLLMTFIFGLVGLLISSVIILVSENRRGLSAKRLTANAQD